MGLNCGCPAGPTIPTIPVEQCLESLGQIQKVIFQRIYSTGRVLNNIPYPIEVPIPEGDPGYIAEGEEGYPAMQYNGPFPNQLAAWTPRFAAVDGTKMTISPFIQGPENEPGGPRKFGGGNATLGGVEIITGRDASTFKANIYSIRQITTIKALKQMQCENIGIYFVDEYGNIAAKGQSASPTSPIFPFQIQQLFIGDKKLGGLENPDGNSIEFSLLPNWSDDLVIIKPVDFNPLIAF